MGVVWTNDFFQMCYAHVQRRVEGSLLMAQMVVLRIYISNKALTILATIKVARIIIVVSC